MKRFQRLLNEGQNDWIITHINHNPFTKIAILTVDHIGKEPGKIRKFFKLDSAFARKQAAPLIKLAKKYGSSVVPKIKSVAVNVR